MEKKHITIDGNNAASKIAYAFSEVAAIYPITPSSPMGELADYWSAKGKHNLYGEAVDVIEMQSEGGASGAVHGSLSVGALTTTFTASQGLLLMIPNMHKIAGEMLPTVFHVASRSLATQSLSIFGDHSDVMSTRNTGFALVAAGSVQEVQDLAVISHLASVEARIPFLNFFDGFRTSHEMQKIEDIDDETLHSMINWQAIKEFKQRALNPENPVAKVGAQNPDVYFQGRETVNTYYKACPDIVKKYMKLFEEKTGRAYKPFDYVGSTNASKIIILMGSGVETVHEVVEYLNSRGDNDVGVIKVRLYRPFSIKDFLDTLPKTVKKIAVLDRTKEPGSIGEPLYLDIVAALQSKEAEEKGFKGKNITVVGGRYGLSSKEFTPTMVKSVYDHLDNACFHNFVVGIEDDITNTSVKTYEEIDSEPEDDIKCKFWGYGSDGTVSANKNTIKIVGENTNKYVQGYFSYDSHKAGGVTVSHLRFSDQKIKSQYLLTSADVIALHKTSYIDKYDVLEGISKGGVFILNCPWSKEEAFMHLTKDMQDTIRHKEIKFYVIDATTIAHEVGLGGRINTAMQAAFFKVAGILPEQEALQMMKDAVKKQFEHKGKNIVEMNWHCIDKAAEALELVDIPTQAVEYVTEKQHVPEDASAFAKEVIEPIMKLKGDSIPVSKMPLDGAIPTNTNKLEKRGIAQTVPRWIPERCIQCGMCAMVCPHAAIRMKQIHPDNLKDAPQSFQTITSNTKNDKDLHFKVQIYPEDCTGCENCNNCIASCPVKDKAIVAYPLEEERQRGENENQTFFESLPDNITDGAPLTTIKGSQFLTPLFEFSGACSGCGETAYIRLATQLFGDRMIIANATGCSSIYGATFPTTPYAQTKEGKGPAWANSLFEDNAEYGFGFRLGIDANRRLLKLIIEKLLLTDIPQNLKEALRSMQEEWEHVDEKAKQAAQLVKEAIPEALAQANEKNKQLLSRLEELQDFLVDKSVWIIGGDGWAYDIGFGGLDHVLATGENVNMLVLDTEVYSNTGGQCSKATPRAATAKFAVAGKQQPKKNLGHMMMSYGNVYIASVSLGANMMHVIKALKEAEEYPGPSLVIAYSPCIAHGIDMRKTVEIEKTAVQTGYWPLYRYDPRKRDEGKEPLQLDMSSTHKPFADYIGNEIRYKSLEILFPDKAKELFEKAEQDATWRESELRREAGKEKKEGE